jgi:hypothetical protein
MTVTFGHHTPLVIPGPEPVVVEIRWTRLEGTRLTGLLTLTSMSRVARAILDATDREDQWLITGGTRRRTLDGMNDYTDDVHHFDRLTPAQAARAAADWLGLTDHTVRPVIVHEYRDGA